MAILSQITQSNLTTPVTLATDVPGTQAILNGADQFVTLSRAIGDADTEDYIVNKDLIINIELPG